MKLVAVTENGQTKVLPMAEPNWQQLWGTGPYVGKKEVALPPVSQEAIGTTPQLPVYTKPVGAGGITAMLPYLAIFVTVGAALGAQAYAHHRAVARERENRYIEGLEQALFAASEINTAMARTLDQYSQSGGTPTQPYIERLNEFLQRANAADAAFVVFGLRASEDDPIAKLIDTLTETRLVFADLAMLSPQSAGSYKRMNGQHDFFVRQLNDVANAARRLEVGKPPPMKTAGAAAGRA